MKEKLYDILQGFGYNTKITDLLYYIVVIISVILVCIITYYITKVILVKIIGKIVKKTATIYDNIFFKYKTFRKIAYMMPGILILTFIQESPVVKDNNPFLSSSIVMKSVSIYLLVMAVVVVFAAIDSFADIIRTKDRYSTKPIRGFLQFIKIIFVIVALIFIIAILTAQQSIGWLAGGIGGFSAVLLLIFKDSILGFVAGIQVTTNNLINLGDWITFTSHNADGEVVDISLNKVVIKNWDKSIVSIPSYKLLEESFINMKGMYEAGARRIKRSIFIDVHSVKFADSEMLEKYSSIDLLKDYVDSKKKEIEIYNNEHKIKSDSLNARKLTNIGTFREYAYQYLISNEKINSNFTIMVRQLQPVDNGLPLEVYCFANETRWVEYEKIQSDIFDHLMTAIREFDLALYQNPSGYDIQSIGRYLTQNKE